MIQKNKERIIWEVTGTNTPLLSTQLKLINKTRGETLNDSLILSLASDSARLKKDDISLSPPKKRKTEKLLNNGTHFQIMFTVN